MSDGTRNEDVRREVRHRRVGPEWFWRLAGVLGIGGPIVNREDMYGDDSRNDPYSQDFDPKWPDRR
ncbi:MAG: hypothetical protein KY456_01090 [Chloroflexi bacterium]|nr:hypothetical protein [Chloroflexota bacterium]